MKLSGLPVKISYFFFNYILFIMRLESLDISRRLYVLWTGVEVKLHFPLCLEANKFSIKKSSNKSSYLILNAKNIVIPCTSIFKGN